MRRFQLRSQVSLALLGFGTACIRRVETLEPVPCEAPAPPQNRSAIAWNALAPQPGAVYGRVIRLDSGEPPADAVVRLWPDSTAHHLTGGAFRFPVSDSGRRRLEVVAVGLEPASAALNVSVGRGTEVFIVLAPAIITFDECGMIMARVRHWRIGWP
jgi:hypothetical protein